jgi:hypothetical protein
MLDAVFACKLVEAYAPVDLSLLADDEAVGVGKEVVDALKGLVKVFLIVCVAFEDGDVG